MRGDRRRARTQRRARSSTRSNCSARDVISVPHEVWWQTMVDRGYEGVDGLFVHPVEDERVMAGNGTIGLEICEQLDEFDTVIVPWGGGGLTTGIASAVKALRPGVRVVTAEPETAAPLSASLAGRRAGVGRLRAVVCRRRGRPRALADDVGTRARGSSTPRTPCRSTTVEGAVRLLASVSHVVAEGAGALALAAALAARRRRHRRARRLHRQRREHRRRGAREDTGRFAVTQI